MSNGMSAFTAQALMKALGGPPAAPIDKAQPWNPAANLGSVPNWNGQTGKGGAMKMTGAGSNPSPDQPYNPAADMGGSSGGDKGGSINDMMSGGVSQASNASAPSGPDPNSLAPGPTGNGIARGVGVTQAQVDAANKDNPYQRDAADVEEGIYGKDRANVLAYAGQIANNQPVPSDIQASIDLLRKAKVYSPVDLGGYSG